jgi:hypothetical protein
MPTSTDVMLMATLHVLCCSPTVRCEMIQIIKFAFPYTTSMRIVLGETQLIMYLKCKNKEYNTFHRNGQLMPLVDLLRLRIKCVILDVIWIFYDNITLASELERRDEVSGLQ